MSTAEAKFVSRFDRIWAQARRVQLSQAILWGVLTALGGIALLAALDYWLELPRLLRIAALAAIGVASVAVAASLVLQSFRRWQRNATAATIERVFPQLGQRIRTTVQYSELAPDEVEEAGVAGTLVAALEGDTVRLAQPLPLDAVVPWKSLAVAGVLAGVVGVLLAGASAVDWQWRAAASRALLGEQEYTRLDVEPGNASVKEGESLLIRILIEGRTGESVTFFTRRTDEAESQWRLETLDLAEAEPAGERKLAIEVPLDRIRHPLEYKVTAGSAETEAYQIEVLYPLKIVRLAAGVQPPEYTGLPESIVEGSSLAALVGSHVKLEIELDRPAQTAELVMQELASRGKPPAAPETLPLVIDGPVLRAEFDLTGDRTFAIVAKSADGMELPENKHRIRARQDEPPQIWFESPAEALEVHTLAELLMRIRVSDDFGLSRTGIVFQVNNEEEYPLLAHDFAEAAAAAEAQQSGRVTPQTRATLERLLPLEHFLLSQQDSVMYYAFAEDIKPDAAQRTETDLRFVDIRPFRRNYRSPPEGEPGMNQGPQLKSLEELIARQRYALNRTIQIARKLERNGQADVSGTDALTKFEAEVAKSTRELAEGLEARGVDPSDTEMLYQAEASMLAASDSLSAGSYDTANLQMRDALKYLIEGRNRLEILIRRNRDRQQLAMLRQFDRMQRQKIRRPKSDEEAARQIAQRLKELADEEDFVYATLSGILDPEAPPIDARSNSSGGSGSSDKQVPPMETNGTNGTPAPENKDDAENKSDATGDSPEPQPADEPIASDTQPAAPTRQELEDKQLDIALEAREIEKALAQLPKATDLAKERMAATAKSAEDSAAALGRGEMEEARGAAGTTREQLRELVEQVEALLAEEQADRIAAAQQMAENLARMQQDFVDRLANPGEGQGQGSPRPREEQEERPGAGKAKGKKGEEKEEPMPGAGQGQGESDEQQQGLGGAAEQIARKADTLADVLGAAARGDAPEELESAGKVADLVNSLELPSLTDRLKNLPGQVEKEQLEDARNTAGDGAERMELAAEELGELHRTIVAPQVAELAKLEQQLTALDEELNQLDSDTSITGWHMEATELLDELAEAGIDEEARQEFIEEMKKAGWGDGARRNWNWGRAEGGYYTAPRAYRTHLSRLSASLRTRMQEYLLGDLRATGDEPIPPQYEELVDRYYEVLSASGRAGVGATKGSQP